MSNHGMTDQQTRDVLSNWSIVNKMAIFLLLRLGVTLGLVEREAAC